MGYFSSSYTYENIFLLPQLINSSFIFSHFCISASWRLPQSFRNKISTDERGGFDEGRIPRHLRSQRPVAGERLSGCLAGAWTPYLERRGEMSERLETHSHSFLMDRFISQRLNCFSILPVYRRVGGFPPRNSH